MGTLFAFSLKSAILLTVIFSAYMLLLSRIKDAKLRRRSLTGIYLISLFLSLFNYEFPVKDRTSGYILSAKDIMEIDAISVSGPADDSSFMLYDIIAITFLIGMIALLLNTLHSIIKIYRLGLNGETVTRDNIKITIISDRNISPFCFWKRIFISKADYSSMPQMVIAHEKSHITHRHYMDLILGRFVLIIQWWNPFAWLMLRELHLVHEFQVDESVLEAGFDREDYQYMLLDRTLGRRHISIVNGLGNSQLKHRLHMMNQNKSNNRKSMKALFLLPATLIGVLLLSSPFITPMIASASKADFTLQSAESQDKKTEANKPAQQTSQTSENPEIQVNDKSVSEEVYRNLNPSKINSIYVYKESDKHPNGLVNIKLKDKVEIDEALNTEKRDNNNFDNAVNNIEVIKVGTIKKSFNPQIFVNGQPISDETLENLDPGKIKKISVFKKTDDQNGKIEITLIDNIDINEAVNSPNVINPVIQTKKGDDVKVVKTGTVKK